ncbi:MAG: MBL fold metallo-hydrolase [Methanomicrobiales archaeon]|nr:MBL fold metallo-hydrolase [Methanomicrobiales archaeon]
MQPVWIPGEGYFANAYVLGSVLVDAGVSPLAVRPHRDAIETIVLTHCHYDHIARVSEIAAMCSAEVWIHHRDAPGLSDVSSNLAMHFGARTPPRVPDGVLDEGDRIGTCTVLHTPGHTPGSICLWDADSRTLISGDTVFADGGFGRVDFPGGSIIDMRQSVERLAALPVEALCPGHGEPVSAGGQRHIEAARRVLRQAYG